MDTDKASHEGFGWQVSLCLAMRYGEQRLSGVAVYGIPGGRVGVWDNWNVNRVEAEVTGGGVPPSADAAVWVRLNLGFEPDAKQARVLSTEINRGILNCT